MGWQFDDKISQNALDNLNLFTADFRELLFSPNRIIEINNFSIAKTTISLEDLLENESDEIYNVDTFDDFCEKLNLHLNAFGMRLPTEDEFEAACGKELFFWGNEIPDGIPFKEETSFDRHREISENGLVLNVDTYKTEIVLSQLKLGDGGESLCGGYVWPIPWIVLSTTYRVPKEIMNEALFEMLETVQVRPVRL